jgi:hypothetical protein
LDPLNRIQFPSRTYQNSLGKTAFLVVVYHLCDSIFFVPLKFPAKISRFEHLMSKNQVIIAMDFEAAADSIILNALCRSRQVRKQKGLI